MRLGSLMMRLIALLFITLLAGCGQKGPLYFAPEEPAAEPVAEQNDNADQPAASDQDDEEQE
jgi:predicted small lipoprotein YifL